MTQQETFQERIRWTEERGVRFLEVHYSGLNEDDMLAMLDLVARQLAESPTNTLRMLVNIEGTTITSAVMTRLKETSKQLNHKLERVAIVGVTGLKMIFLQALNAVTGAGNKQKLCASDQEARAWLTSR